MSSELIESKNKFDNSIQTQTDEFSESLNQASLALFDDSVPRSESSIQSSSSNNFSEDYAQNIQFAKSELSKPISINFATDINLAQAERIPEPNQKLSDSSTLTYAGIFGLGVGGFTYGIQYGEIKDIESRIQKYNAAQSNVGKFYYSAHTRAAAWGIAFGATIFGTVAKPVFSNWLNSSKNN